jgi:hypothetical protein
MIEGGKDAGLRYETTPNRRVSGEGHRKLLDRHPPAKLPVLAGDHYPHATLTQFLADVIGRQRVTE